MRAMYLVCTKCGQKYSVDGPNFRCRGCSEPLELEPVTQGRIIDGNPLRQNILDRYADFFPFEEVNADLSLKEGFTALVEANDLAVELGVGSLYLKNETQNPTWSFKDRGTMVGLQHAYALGYRQIGTVSSGNMATSVAAYGARAGLKTYVLVSSTIAAEKLNPIAIYGAELITVEGDYGDLYYESLRIGEENDIYFINSDSPFRVEGSKTIAFEICEQLNFDVPDYVVIPTSAGGNLRGIEKGFHEFHQAGLIRRVPTIVCAQAAGCSPIATAWNQGAEEIDRVAHPHTIAHAIENPFPPSGNQVLRVLRRSGGTCVTVSDDEILAAQADLAKVGVFGQPASAVPVASIRKLKAAGYLQGDDRIVAIVTGSGLKYTAAFNRHNLDYSHCRINELGDLIRSKR